MRQLTVLPADAKRCATAAETRRNRFGRAARRHRDRVGIRVAADREAVGGAVGEADRAEVGQWQHAAGAGWRLGDPLRRAEFGLARALIGRERPALGRVADGQRKLAAAVVLDLGADVVARQHRI